MRVSILFGVLLVVLASVGSPSRGAEAEHTKDSLDTVKKAVTDGKAVLIDVREKSEWDDGHLKDAKLLPLSTLKAGAKAEDLARVVPKDKVVYLHCGSGVRCLKAADELKKLGYDVRPLKDGYKDLLKAGFEKAAMPPDNPKDPDVELELTAAPDEMPLFKGKATPVWRYTGKVLKGRKDALSVGDGYLGPTIHLIRGERVRIHFVNNLDEPSIIHWHGLIVPHAADGLPSSAVKPKGRYTYDFTVTNHAGTYPYHPHPHMRTGLQVYRGLAGVVIVRDPAEDKIGLPAGEQDLCLVVQDRRVDGENRFVYSQAMMDQMSGMLGGTILVNGRPDASFRVERRPYRLRLVNASNARIYKLAWSDGSPMHVIGTDGGLLSGDEGPQKRPFVVLGPFERIDLWEDFSTRKAGAELALVSEKFTIKMGMNGMGGMRPGMGGPGMMMNMNMGGERLQIARIEVKEGDAKPGRLPTLPGTKPKLAEAKREIRTTLAFRMMRGLFNGRTFKEDDLTDAEKLKLGEPVIWTFDNASEMGMQMPHPVHIHGVQFRVIERKGDGAGELAKGIIDDGWKDTVLIFPGETVKLYLRPTEAGRFLYHCHNLEHEDMGMMRWFLVTRE